MATKTDFKLLGLIAFVALILATVCYVLAAIGGNGGILNLISQIGLLTVVLFMAWYYVKRLSQIWHVIFFVIAIIAVISLFAPVFNFNIQIL